jgi:hypothetical protein
MSLLKRKKTKQVLLLSFVLCSFCLLLVRYIQDYISFLDFLIVSNESESLFLFFEDIPFPVDTNKHAPFSPPLNSKEIHQGKYNL